MDFELDDDQLELQRVAAEIVARECPSGLVRQVVAGRDDAAGWWKTLVGLDWPALTVPEADGGMGFGPVESVIVIEQLGWGCDPSPLIATTSQYLPVVRGCVSGPARAGLLAAVVAGETGACVEGPDTVTASQSVDGWTLTGTVADVVDGDRADRLAVIATTPAGPGVFVVDPSAATVTAVRQESFDGSLHVATVTFESTPVPADHGFVGPEVADGIDAARFEALAGWSAMTVGACQRILDLVVEHIKARHQFGVAIGSFQAVKHMAVDMFVTIERARALAQFAALCIHEADPRQDLAAAMAKAAAGDCQRLVTRHGIQLFGGLGFTWENDLQIYVRRAKAGELLFGGATTHRATVARLTLQSTLETPR